MLAGAGSVGCPPRIAEAVGVPGGGVLVGGDAGGGAGTVGRPQRVAEVVGCLVALCAGC